MVEITSDTYRKAAVKLDELGWCQGTFKTERGVCAMGAIGCALSNTGDIRRNSNTGWTWVPGYEHDINLMSDLGREVSSVFRTLPEEVREGYKWVHRFNDAPKRTKEEVKSILLWLAEAVAIHENSKQESKETVNA